MKFFLPELDFCFGATVITPATEMISVDVSTTRRRVTQGNSTKNWRPELAAIAEDNGALNACRQSRESTTSVVRSEKKPLSKPRSAGKTRSHSYSGDYRLKCKKLSNAMAIPAFSPTPFVF